MELVYLWVGEYKNIKSQGFNFSPRFECTYEKNELTIVEKKEDEYIKDFFGSNINVTAIVGENGSGKSSILKFIRQIIDKKVTDKSFLIFYNKGTNKYHCIYAKDEIIYNGEKDLNQDTLLSNDIVFPLFDYSLTYDSLVNFQSRQLPVYPSKLKGLYNFNEELILNQKNIMQNYHILKNKNQLDKFKDFFQPDTIKVIFYLDKFKSYKKELILSEVQNYQDLIDKFSQDISIEEFLKLIKEIFTFLSKKKYFQDKQMEVDKIFKEQKDIDLSRKELFDAMHKDDDLLKQQLVSLEQKNHNSYADGYTGNNIWEHKTNKGLLFNLNRRTSIVKEEEDKYCLFSFDVNELSNESIDIILDSFPLEYFKIELIDINKKELSDLSFGEQQLIFILNQIYRLTLDNNILILLLDEIDIGFHPDWQKRIIQYIIDFLNSTDDKKYYHLIFTTHSPFLLSDIPKENIIFLNDESSITQTFGANIHTLLSDSFFMEDGLMGEFAKNKIRIIRVAHKYIIHKHKRETLFIQASKRSRRLLIKQLPKFWQIQKIIGEPFLQKIVKNQLEEIELVLLGRNEAIDNEIARLQNLKKSLK